MRIQLKKIMFLMMMGELEHYLEKKGCFFEMKRESDRRGFRSFDRCVILFLEFVEGILV